MLDEYTLGACGGEGAGRREEEVGMGVGGG